jgi:predicted NAD/FAD-dependent oxidoreductase
METDVVVVGAGLAGLTAAQLVRQAGLGVRVIDSRPPGGRGRSHNRGGFTFNLGPRAVYLGGPAARILIDLGCSLSGGSPSVSNMKFHNGDSLDAAPASPLGVLKTHSMGLADKARFAKLMSGLGRVDPNDFAHLTVDEWLKEEGLGGKAGSVVRAFVRLATYCADTHILSADVAISSLRASAKGVRYLDGGWQSLVDHLADGLDITQSTVRKVTQSTSNKTASLRLQLESGETLCTRSVVLALQSSTQVTTLLGLSISDDDTSDTSDTSHTPQTSIEAACLTVGLADPPSHPFVLSLDSPLYLSAHSPAARLSDEGTVVHLMKYLRHGENHDPVATKSEMLTLLHLSGVETSSVLQQEYLHRMTVTSVLPTPTSGGLAGRPSVTAFADQGIFLAGDWVGRKGFLLDAACSSAEAAASEVIRLMR